MSNVILGFSLAFFRNIFLIERLSAFIVGNMLFCYPISVMLNCFYKFLDFSSYISCSRPTYLGNVRKFISATI